MSAIDARIVIHQESPQRHAHRLTGSVPERFFSLDGYPHRAQSQHLRNISFCALHKLDNLLVLRAYLPQHLPERDQKLIFKLEQLTCFVEELEAVLQRIVLLIKLAFRRESVQKVKQFDPLLSNRQFPSVH